MVDVGTENGSQVSQKRRIQSADIERWIALLLLIILGLAPAIIWLHPGSIIAGADFNVPFDMVHTFNSIWSGWLSNQGAGAATFGSSSGGLLSQEIPYLGLLAFAKAIGFSSSVAETLVFAGIVLAPGLAMWKLLGRSSLGVPGRFAGSIMYMLNPYVLIFWHSGEAIELIAYCLAPLVLLLIDVGLREPILPVWFWPSLAIVALALAAPASNPPTIVGYVLLPAIIFTSTRFAIIGRTVSTRVRLRRSFLGVSIGCAVNAWWLLPTLFGALNGSLLAGFSASYESQNPPDLTTSVPAIDSILNFGSWAWRKGYQGQLYTAFENDYHSWLMWVVATIPIVLGIVGVMQLFDASKRIRYRSLGSPGAYLWLVGSLLALGFHGPFGNLYLWAFHYVPGMFAFRSPWEKFEPLAVMGVALLSATSVDAFMTKIGSIAGFSFPTKNSHSLTQGYIRKRSYSPRRNIRSLNMAMMVIIGSLSVALVFPMFGGFGGMFTSKLTHYYRKVPSYVTNFANSVDKLKQCEIFFPQEAWTAYSAFSWFRGGTTNFDELFRCAVIQANAIPSNAGEYWASLMNQGIESHVAPRQLAAILGSLGVTDIVVATDYDHTFYNAGPTTNALQAYFSHQQVFKMKRFGSWFDYKVPTDRVVPTLYAANNTAWTPNLATLIKGSPNGAVFDALSKSLGKRGVILDGLDKKVENIATSVVAPLGASLHSQSSNNVVSELLGSNRHGKLILRLNPIPLTIRSLSLDPGLIPGTPCVATTSVTSLNQSAPNVTSLPLNEKFASGAGVTIQSKNALGDCVIETVPLSSNVIRVQFSYKYQSGLSPQYAIGPNGANVLAYGKLSRSNVWKKQVVFILNASIGAPIELFLYSESSGTKVGRVEYRDIKISESQHPVLAVTMNRTNLKLTTPEIRSNGSTWLIQLSGPAVVVSPIAFDPGWTLSLHPVGKAVTGTRITHLAADGYSNGWLVTGNGAYTASLTFAPAKVIKIGIVLAVIALLLTFLSASIEVRKSVRRWVWNGVKGLKLWSKNGEV